MTEKNTKLDVGEQVSDPNGSPRDSLHGNQINPNWEEAVEGTLKERADLLKRLANYLV